MVVAMSLKWLYELMLLFSGSLSEVEVKKRIDQIKKDLVASGAEKISEDYWGRRDLAYKLGSDYSGYFSFLKMALEANQIEAIKLRLAKMEDVLRFMVTKVGNSQ